MADYEYEEENLDDFMINASMILSENDNPEKDTIIESLKQHLSSISENHSELQNFYKTLNLVIFKKNSKEILHKQAFKLYPIIFSFNPNSSFYCVDFFLFSIDQAASEENKSDFAYLSIIFSEVVLAFFSDENNNKYLISKNYLLENNKKYKLYEKLLNFCKEKIKTNKKTEQSFGCLLLTELIEKCPIVKEEKYLDNIFAIIASYYDDKLFICKLDLLNCTISLIFTAETKFKPYAHVCLFKVLDFLTDNEWMKRKLAINIVYTLIFYCKEEIMGVKDNIVEFLNTLKEDPVEEVREVCIQTLKFIEENETGNVDERNKEIANKNIIENEKLKTNDNQNKNKKLNQKEIKNTNKSTNYNNKIKINDNKARDKKVINIKNKKEENNNENNSEMNSETEPKQISNFRSHNIKVPSRLMQKKKANEEFLKKQLLKEKIYLEKKEKELNEKTKNNISLNFNNDINKPKPNSYKPKQKQNKTIAALIKEFSVPGQENKKKDANLKNNKKNNQNNINKSQNELNSEKNNLKTEQYKSTLNSIAQQLNIIQQEQNEFVTMINNLQNSIKNNYTNLNERISALEKYYSVK